MIRLKLVATASAAALAAGFGAASGGVAHAQAAGDLASTVQVLQMQVTEQKAQLERQQAEIERLRAISDTLLQAARGAGAPGAAAPSGTGAPPPIQLAQATPVMGATPVGEAPPEQEKVVIAAVPEGQGVLTQRGHFVLEPQFDYTHGSTNRLVFRGVEIVTGIQIGVIEASDADRNAVSAALDARYGLTNRLEVEARIPYVYRADRVTTLAQRDNQISQDISIKGKDLGDIEMSARYQLNRGLGAWPVFVAGLRVKTDTGTNPFEIERDEFGVAEKLATGSGFWGVEGSLTFLYPTDPAVLFGGISYLAHLSKDIDKTIGAGSSSEVHVGRVDPGDSITANAGFGFALNPRFSFSLGYKHTFIYPTRTELGDTTQRSQSLQVGAFTFGWSFLISDRITLTNTYEIGTTRDAPDMRVVFRLPIRF